MRFGNLLPPLNRSITVASVLIVIATLLGITTGPIAEPTIRDPLIIHFLLTALLFLLVTQWMTAEESDEPGVGNLLKLILFRLPLGALGGVSLMLALNALTLFKTDLHWVMGLAIPGIAGVWTFFAYDDFRKKAALADQEETAPGVFPTTTEKEKNHAASAAAASNPSPSRTFNAYFLSGVAQASYLSSIIITIGLGTYYYTILKSAFIDGVFKGWGSPTRIFEIIWEAAGASVIAVAVTLVGLFTLMGVGIASWQALRRSSKAGYDRELSDAELRTISIASEKMRAYLEQEKNTRLAAVAYWTVILGFVALMLGSIFLFLGDEGWGSSLFVAQRTEGLNWYIYRDEVGVAEVIFVFTLIFLYFTAAMGVGIFWREFGEYGYLLSKQQSGDVIAQLETAIAEEVRKGVIKENDAFDPSEYLWSANRTMTSYFGVAAVLLAVINIGFWYLDRMSYTLISEEGIVYTDYWTTKTHKAGYDEIEAIEVSCRIDDEDDLIVRYGFLLNTQRSVTAVNYNSPKLFRNNLTADLKNWVRADSLARQQGAMVRSNMLTPWVGKPSPRYNEEDCRLGLQEYFDKETTESVMRLLN